MSDESETVYEFSGPHGTSEEWGRSWPLDEIKDRLASGEDRVRFGGTIWRIRPSSPTAAADPFARVKELPEWSALNEAVCASDDLDDYSYRALVTLRAQQFVAVVGGTANEATS